MKKFLKALTAVFAVAILAFAIVGCATANVSGKTYVFSDLTVSYSSEVDDTTKEFMNGMLDGMREEMEGQKVTFNEDGTVAIEDETGLTWTQEGNKVTISAGAYSQEYTVNGNKLEITNTESGITMTIIFVQE
ncbi:MAG: hypothetical protein ACI4MC_00805 [Candidatus Coproplasma sp.]